MASVPLNLDDWEVVPRDVVRSHWKATKPVRSEDDDIQDETVEKEDVVGIFASLLIPGKGEPQNNQAVLLDRSSGRIVHVGNVASLPSKYSDVELKRIPVLMPGMWECHSHFMGASPNNPINSESLGMTNPAEAGARNVRALKETLYAGFTSCVDLGGYACELQKVIDEGLILGPTLYGAGAAISMTAGHGEIFEIPYGSARQKLGVNAPGTDAGVTALLLADGVDECRKAVRLNLRRGARVIKVFTSGGVTSRDDVPMYQQFSDEELTVIVQEAKRMGLICAAHAVGKAGILAAIRTGFKVIEHDSFGDDEVFEAMKKNDVMLVATITPLESIMKNKDKYPAPMYKKAVKMAKTHMAAYKSAVVAGVKCALGSDLFGGIGTVLSPGMNGNEVSLAVTTGGMTPLEAIAAATAHGPATVGPQAPKSGQIKSGYDADLLGLEENPLDHMETFRSPKNIKFIWKGGRLVKAPGLDPWEVLGT